MLLIKIIDRAETIIIRIISIFILLIAAYAMYDSYNVLNNAQIKEAWVYKPEVQDGEIVYPKNLNGMVAWITIDDTNIDYPVMQGTDNIEYLNKDPFGKYSLSGSLFLDANNHPDFTDPYSLIYGHHMEGGLMFGALDDYKDEEYFDSHKKGQLIVGDKVYDLTLFAYMDASAKDQEIFSPADDFDRFSFIKEYAGIYREPEDGRLIAMSTCVNTSSYDRTVVFGIIH